MAERERQEINFQPTSRTDLEIVYRGEERLGEIRPDEEGDMSFYPHGRADSDDHYKIVDLERIVREAVRLAWKDLGEKLRQDLVRQLAERERPGIDNAG